MRYLLILFFFGIIPAQAQVDYNTTKGFIAAGFDVVSYFENKAEVGHMEFVANYDGAKFKFASQEHLECFKANPKKYIPQYGGYCAYAIALKGKKVSINPKTFEIRNGKLYLFYNSWGTNTLKLWKENILKGLEKKADQNWNSIKLID